MISLRYQCPQCDNRVHVQLDTDDEDIRIDVRCATRHPRPVRMDRIETPVPEETPTPR